MWDWLQKLRLNEIFGGQQQQPTFGGSYNPGGGQSPYQTPPFVPPQGGGGNIMDRVSQIYQPETQSIDKYNQMIGEYPVFEDPSKKRKFFGAAMGALTDLGTNFGGNKTGVRGTAVYDEAIGKNKFRESVENWKNQIEPLERSANIERQSNTNNRTMAMQTVSAQLRQDAQDAKEANDMRRADIAQQRADAYEFKIRNPNVQFDFSTPWVMIKDPKTGNVMKATDSQGRPIPTGSMSDQDKISLQQQGRMEVVREQGQTAQDLEATRQGGREDLQDKRAWSVVNAIDPADGQQKSFRVNSITGEVQPMGIGAVRTPGASSSGGGGALPTQQRVDYFNKAQELYNTRPDLRPFIQLGRPGSNDFEVAKPNTPSQFMGMSFGKAGPTPEQAAEIQQYIYGGNRTNVPPPPGTTTPPGGRQSGPGRMGGPPPADMAAASKAKRDRAIQELQAAGKPVTEQNIAFVMRQIK